jgi:dihydrodipicolinate synthase/N-acetylneuraminate lyase
MHLGFMAPHVGGVLVGGSTGDAWEMNGDQILELLDIIVPDAQKSGTELLVGILRPTIEAMVEQLEAVIAWACRRAGTEVVADAFAASGLKGITLAPPTSSSPLSQTEIGTALAPLLARGLPVALYQLPQVTGNLMQPELVADLATRFTNVLLFKDSSGTDEVAQSGVLPAELILLRGAEGGFASWLKDNGGCYNGFLLSSANSVPAELAALIRDIRAGRIQEGKDRSARISAVIGDAFAAVDGLPYGNAFSNANRALAHCMAYGSKTLDAPLPRLYSGSCLPKPVIKNVMDTLQHHDLLPRRGYLA